MTPYERAEEQLVNDLNEGRIDQREFNAEMRQMRADVRAEAEDAAQAAYDDVMERW